MSSFGRGRGILPSKQAVPPLPLMNAKNGFNSNHADGHQIIVKVTTVIPPVSDSISNNIDNSSEAPSLHNFGEKLLSLQEKDSLFPIILDVINSPSCTENTVTRMVEIIIDRCMWLPMISRKYAALLLFLSSHKIFGKEIRRVTFNTLQVFYEDRNSLNKYGSDAFRKAVILTGEMYYRYRVGNRGYKILCVAVLDYMKTLVDSVDDDDLLILVQQLSWNCKEMKEIDKDAVNQLMSKIRKNLTIQSSAYSETGRLYLLLCLELHYLPFDCLSEECREFYSKSLGEEIFSTIQPPPLELDNHLEYYNSIHMEELLRSR